MPPESGSRAVTISPPCLRGPRAVGAKIHVDARDVEEMDSTDARALATALLEGAKELDELNAAALPHLDAFVAAVEEHLTPAERLGVSDEDLGSA